MPRLGRRRRSRFEQQARPTSAGLWLPRQQYLRQLRRTIAAVSARSVLRRVGGTSLASTLVGLHADAGRKCHLWSAWARIECGRNGWGRRKLQLEQNGNTPPRRKANQTIQAEKIFQARMGELMVGTFTASRNEMLTDVTSGGDWWN